MHILGSAGGRDEGKKKETKKMKYGVEWGNGRVECGGTNEGKKRGKKETRKIEKNRNERKPEQKKNVRTTRKEGNNN